MITRYLSLFLAAGLIVLLPSVSHAEPAVSDKGEVVDNSQTKAAIDGNCPVCFMNGYIHQGSDRITAVYRGKKYQFDTGEDKKLFQQNPEIYTQGLEIRYKEKIK